jgi:hypothetical protein
MGNFLCVLILAMCLNILKMNDCLSMYKVEDFIQKYNEGFGLMTHNGPLNLLCIQKNHQPLVSENCQERPNNG